ncbi:DUF2252 family protein [Bradyrhizobium lablabi]|uniref:DUF2252 family protein n=1 Tax=Bradyrhizobium lablabi TaxID=722472 RepID=UPI001BA53B1A|nr:DUF2252 family protein [Bradyrhizobium lablabi]MBR1121517.1 DUF2252 family protein [Bradyrhizobium lablabi]
MSFVKDNDAYEAWLARQCDVVKEDIKLKHEEKMTDSAFSFLRATYFRWARKIGSWCPELMDAPNVLAVGDLHLENFGTWRDEDGRLVWGVNDFDEAAVMPYTLDLARLVTSIQLAPRRHEDVNDKAAAKAVLKGYRQGLDSPQPALLFEGETWLWDYALPDKGGPRRFWKEVDKYPKAKRPPDARIKRALIESMPEGIDTKTIHMRTRQKGSGSLGRPRYVAVGYWRGGRVLREAKALVPSAWTWANGQKQESRLLDAANGPYRAPDPLLDVRHKFIFRRIAGDAEKIELGKKAGANIHLELLRAMGFDLASVHAASARSAGPIRKDLDKRPRGWLNKAAAIAATEVERDFHEWNKYMAQR